MGSATASQTPEKPPLRSQEDSCVNEPASDEVFTSEYATVSPRPISTKGEDTQNSIKTGFPNQN